jgi:outer membrane protein assembly factor BamB
MAENQLGEQIEASPAFSNGQIFIRTFQNLYCIEAK